MYFRKAYFDENNSPVEVEVVCEKCESIITIDKNFDDIFSKVESESCNVKDPSKIICSCGNICNSNIIKYKTLGDIKKTENSSILFVPKCPTCGSPNLSKISATKKVAKIAAFGIFGMGDNGKTWKCNNCGSKF